MDREEIEFLLENKPAPATLQPFRKQAGKRNRERADAAMWQAIDHNDERALAAALAMGARAKTLRNGTPPVWYCAQAGQMGLVKQLIDAGADPSALAKGATIWTAIASRDDPHEAQNLSEIIGGLPRLDTQELATRGAWRLMVWAARKQGHMRASWNLYKPDGMGETHLAWINAAVHGPEEIIGYLSKEWGCAPGTPVEQMAGHGIARGAWEQAAISDDIDKATRLLRHEWLPPEKGNDQKMSSHRRPISPLWQHGMGWVFLGKGAWNLWAWWMLSEKRRQQFNQALRQHPSQTLWQIAGNRASLERLVVLGIDLDVRDDQGNTLAHGLFASKGLTKTMAQWWIDHRPQDLHVRNKKGLTALEVGSEREPALAWARSTWMAGKTKKALTPTSAPARL